MQLNSPTGYIRISDPKDADEWGEPNTFYQISWESSNSITHLKVELYKGTELVVLIVNDYVNSGNYDWLITNGPQNYANGTDYRIKITDYDNANNYNFSAYFEIKIPAPEEEGGCG